MELLDRTHKDVSWDWIGAVLDGVRAARRHRRPPLRLVNGRVRRGMTG